MLAVEGDASEELPNAEEEGREEKEEAPVGDPWSAVSVPGVTWFSLSLSTGSAERCHFSKKRDWESLWATPVSFQQSIQRAAHRPGIDLDWQGSRVVRGDPAGLGGTHLRALL